MGDDIKAVWVAALAEFLGTLCDAERRRVSSVSSLDDLLRHVETLRISYHTAWLTRALDRLQPVFGWLHSYNHCVQSYLQAAPAPFCILWGSVCLVLEITARNHRAVDNAVAAFEEAYRHGPRFQHYTTRLNGGAYKQLEVALVKYHIELIGLCQDTIAFFRASPKSEESFDKHMTNALILKFAENLFFSTFKPFTDRVEPRIQKLRDLTAWVDREAVVASTERLNNQYDELKSGVQGILQRLNPQCLIGSPATMLLTDSFQNLPPKPGGQICYGRKNELERLVQYLRPGDEQIASRTACLYGMRGSGKTHLALEYAYGHIYDYKVILWVSAETSLKLQQSFDAIAHQMGLADGSVQHPDQLREIVKRWLSNSQKRGGDASFTLLMIFDNVQSLQLLTDYLPQMSRGAIIFTTTSEAIAWHCAGVSGAISITPFSGELGAELLLILVRNEAPSSEELTSARSVSEAMGSFPLALDLVGNYVRGLGMSYTSFLRKHPHFETDFLFNPDLARWTPPNFEESISRIWALHLPSGTLDTGGKLDSKACRLIDYLSFLDKDGVSLTMFQDITTESMLFEGPDCPDEIADLDDLIANPFNQLLALEGAIMNLHDRALVKVNDETKHIDCHRLIRHAVSKSMTKRIRYRTFNRLVFILNASFPKQNDGGPLHSKWSTCSTLAGQVSALLNSYSEYRGEVGHPILLCEVAARCAWYFLELGQFHVARQMTEQSLNICDLALSQRIHPGYSSWFIVDMTTHLFNVLATIQREQPSDDAGVSLSQKVLDTRIANRRPSNAVEETWIAAAEGNLAVSLMAVGRAEEAYDILIRLKQRDDMKPNEDIYLRNTCLCLMLLGRTKDALICNSEALGAAKQKRGENSEQVATCYFDVANIHKCKGEKADALDAVRKCLALRKVSMPLHQVTAFTLHKVGEIVSMDGDYEASIPFYEQALEILSSCECHPGSLCRTAYALVKVCRLLGDQVRYDQYRLFGESRRRDIKGVDTVALGLDPENYNKFIPVGLR